MTGKNPLVLGRLAIELNHIPLLENNVVLTVHYAKIMESWHNGRVTRLAFISNYLCSGGIKFIYLSGCPFVWLFYANDGGRIYTKKLRKMVFIQL